jgi:DNA-directed RNA polymerase subunit omega
MLGYTGIRFVTEEENDSSSIRISLLHHCGIGFLGDSGRSRSTKEESQPPVRAKVGATLVPGRKSESIMKADLIAAASKVITNQQILVNMVSRRVRQLSLGHRPLVEYAPGLREADIALTEIANKKLTFESTFGQNGTEPVPHVVQFPEVIAAKKAVAKKKAA